MASTSDLIVGADGHFLGDAEAIGKHPPDYILGLAREGQITVGIEGGDPDLAYAVQKLGPELLMLSSDFPHEVNGTIVREEIGHLRDDPQSSDEAERATLGGNAARFFGLG